MTTSTATIKKDNSTLVIAAVLAAAGVAAWIYQLSQGMQVTGLGQQIVWGLYIAGFFTAVGAGAGLLALTGASEFMPLLEKGKRTASLNLALASLVVGGLLIGIDVGNPAKMLNMVFGFHFSSMMTWDFWLLAAAVVVALVYQLMSKQGKDAKTIGAIGMIVGAAVVMVEGWMLSTMAAHPMWTSSFTVVSFLLGAAVAGLSLAVVAGLDGEKLQGWLTVALWLSLALVAVEVLTSLVGGHEEINFALAGTAAPAFWLQLAAGLILPLVMLSRKVQLQVAGMLALLGVLAEKTWTLTAGAAKPWQPFANGAYAPSWVEYVAVIGMVAVGVLVFRLLSMAFKSE